MLQCFGEKWIGYANYYRWTKQNERMLNFGYSILVYCLGNIVIARFLIDISLKLMASSGWVDNDII